MSSQAVYCLSLQIQPNENGQNTVSSSNVKNEATTLSTSTKKHLESMQQQQQQQQQQQPPLQHQQLANNIILLRGSRNENGQIIIQNKHDIISFINEQQQQQQQIQHDKQLSATATTLATQLPTTTTIARKVHAGISVVASTTPGGNGNISKDTSQITTAAGTTATSQNAAVPTTSNTILLQTPINASQLESVLLQSSNMKKTTTSLNERSFLIKNSSRSLSTDSNRISNSDSKGPFVLQTLKRLEKSQSILVIRNSSSNNLAAAASSTSTTTSTSTSTSKYNASNNGNISNELSNFTLPTTATVSTNTGVTTPQGVLVNNNNNNSNNNSSNLTSLSFTRASKGQQQQTKLANIIAANRTVANSTLSTSSSFSSSSSSSSSSTSSVSLSTSSAALSTSLSSLKSSTSNGTTTTTTFLRLGSNTTVAAAAAAFANKNRNSNSKVNTNNIVVVSGTGNNSYNSNNNQSNNRNILNGVTTTATLLTDQQQQTTQKLSLADVQLKHERTTSSSSTSTTTTTVAAGQHQTNVPLGNDGEPIKLPDNLESLPRADSFPSQRHRWNTNEEIAAILISFDKHNEWQSKEVKTRPKSGSLLLYSRKKVRYRRDGYCWKKRKDGKTTREDHMKLKVQGTECIYGCYVHSAILPTFHRRCYWLLQNPDIVLVHYLNVPYPDDNKMAVIAPSITLWGDKKEWTKEELVSQLKPMLSSVTSDDDSDSGNDIEISTAETVESIVCQLMEKQRLSRQAALVKQLDCGCADSSCVDGKSCSHPVMRRTGLLKSVSDKRGNFSDNYNQATSTTPNVVIGPKLYSRWPDRRQRDDTHHYQQQPHHAHQQLTQEGAIKFQIIQPQHNEQHQQQHHQLHQQQPQHYRQHNNNTHVTPHHQLFINRNNLIIQHHQQQQHTNFNQANTAAATTTTSSNVVSTVSNNQNNQINLQRFVANHNNSNNNNNLQLNNNRLQIAKTTITATPATPTALTEAGSLSSELIGNQNHISANSNINSNKINRNSNQLTLPAPQQHQQQQQQQQQQQNLDTNAINNNNYNYNTSVQQQQQQELYKMQQQHKHSTTKDIKIDFQPTQQHTASSSSSNSVQPMCMSPEHQPSTPTHGNNASQNNSHPLLAQGGSSTLANITSSSSPAAASNSSSSSSSSSCSYPSPLIDDNVVNQKQLSPANTTITMIKAENLISANEQQNQQQQNCAIAVDNMSDTAATAAEMSTGDANSQQQQQSSTVSFHDKLTEYNNNNTNGCQTLSASNDSNSNSTATIATADQQLEGRNQEMDNNSNNTHNTIDFESMETNNIESRHPIEEHATTHAIHDTLGFFNETLDLSQEDIQRTLIANLPFDTTEAQAVEEKHVVVSSGLNFLANNGTSDANDAIPVPGNINCEDDDETDDVFVNLDAFDMLVEFPDLDLDDKQALSHASLEHAAVSVQLGGVLTNHNQNSNVINQHLVSSQSSYEANEKQTVGISSTNCSRKLLNICDFSPEWSYPEGGVKVLVAGPWTSSNALYTVLFDSLPVPTLLVQEGVLRCYCPAHDVGFATLQVSCDGYVVSNSVMFEYKMSPCPEAPNDATSNDCLYKFSLLNRLSSIDEKMQIKTEAGTLSEQHSLFFQSNFEEKLVSYCHQLMKGTWRSNTSSWTSGIKGMSLLHLAAALGYSKLVCAMLNWRAENPNFILETELDALSQDIYGYTPMTWACARGHIDTALILYKWNQNALKIKNYAQQSPLDVANLKGHKTLLSEIYRLEYERNKKYNKNYLGTLSLNLNKYEFGDKNSTTKIEHTSTDEFFEDKVGEHIFAGLEGSFDMPRSHDGVFLRPVALASNQSPPNYSRFSKRSSVDSGINMDIRGKPGKSLKDISRLQSFDTHDNYSLSVESTLDNFNTSNATNSLLSPMRKMDFALCEVSTGDSSPLPDKDHDDSSTINNDDIADVVINSETDGVVGDSDAKVLTLAEHIIAAMPERIKNEADEMMVLGSPITEPLNSESSGLNDSFMDPLLDSLPNTHFDSDFSLDFNDHSYRYHDVSTPCSSLSPASSGPLQSPASYSLLGVDPSVNSPSPPPSTKQLTEFLHASSCNQYPFEADFSRLTLTDSEQRELYEAAKCIQKAYRSYKGRQKLEEQNKERSAAIVIQNYYRRYKQYAYYRQMTNAALVIQHGYRSYCRHKRFKKSQSSTTTPSSLGGGSNSSQNNLSSNSQCLSSFYDHFKNDQQQHELMMNSQPSTPKETSPSGPLKRTYSQSTQNQAARKIQQFMRQSRIKLQRERAEKEKLVHQRRAEYLQSLQYQGQVEIVCNPEQSEPNHVKLFNTLHQQEQ